MKGLFIAFEGIDGCGKSTQVWKTAKYLADKSKYNHVVVTREPYKNQDIRKILQSEDDPYSQAMNLAELYIEDRKRHAEEILNPNLEKGCIVISDRYILSTFAYQQAQGISMDKLVKMHNTGSLLPFPDITFVVDVPAEVAIERMKKDMGRNVEQKFEKNAEFISKIRNNYIELARPNNYNPALIDGRKSIEEIFEIDIKPKLDVLWSSYTKA